MDVQTCYQEAIKFATNKHVAQSQTIADTNLPYVVHLSNVAMEVMIAAAHTPTFNLEYAVQVALLHDTLEDTDTSFSELEKTFGTEVAQGVWALTKDHNLPKEERMENSLKKIKKLPSEIWAIKLADRITNMQAPPSSWTPSKKAVYSTEAVLIWETLKEGNKYLADRLATKIKEYQKYLNI